MKYDLSIIIPIYNGEKYLQKCIESIKKNSINYEIIIINDGSKDNTKKILETLKNKNIKVINLKNNHGVSYARNCGIKNIKGKYFTFIDIDDYIKEKAFDKTFQIAINNDLDILGYNYYEIKEKIIKSKYKYDNKIMNNEEFTRKILNDEISMVIWDKIYKTEKFKDIRFDEKLKINEDYLYTINCIQKANKTMFVNNYLYNYCKTENSLTNKYTCKNIKNNNYIKYIDKKTINELEKYKEYKLFISKNELKNIHLYSKCKDKKNRKKYLKENINKELLKYLLKSNISILNKIEITIYLISINLHLFLYPFYNKIKNILRS